MTERRTIEIARIFSTYDDDLCIDLKDFADTLEGYRLSCPEGTNPCIYFCFDRGYYDSGDTVEVKIIRDETQEEADERAVKEAEIDRAHKAQAERDKMAYELRQLAALKAKYEGGA
jgi:hypothetical protein